MSKSRTIITFDNGNSNPHLGIYQDGERVAILDQNQFTTKYPYHEWKDWTFVVSHVGGDNEFTEAVFALPQTKVVRALRKNNQLGGMKIHYSESLGDDRLVQAYALFQENKNEESILIDVGTFMTVDVVNEKGLVGGYIFPGLQSFLNSYIQGAHLPRLSENNIPWGNPELPHSTEEAILKAAAIYLDGILSKLTALYPDAHYVLTGGRADLIKDRLKVKKLTLNPYLIHDALFELSSMGVNK